MLALIRGAGDIASGAAIRLWRCGIDVVMTDLARPTAIRRTVALSDAIVHGETTVEGLRAVRAENAAEAEKLLHKGVLPVLADPECRCREALSPDALVDAILAKRNLGTKITDAPIVVGVGPGFTAGEDCHAVVETMRGHTLGRVIYSGSALPNTNIPGLIGGFTGERVLRAPCDGIFTAVHRIGDTVEEGETIGFVAGQPRQWSSRDEVHHQRRAARRAGRWRPRQKGHEVRRRRPALQAGVLHDDLGQGARRRRRRGRGGTVSARKKAG